MGIKFTVIDTKTGKYPDLDAIREEPWAKGLMGRLNGCFVLSEEGGIGVEDRGGNVRWADIGRFEAKIVA